MKYLLLFLYLKSKVCIFVKQEPIKPKTIMKRFVLFIAAIMCFGTASAQTLDKTLAEAQIEYDRAIEAQRGAIAEARSDERRITTAAEERLDQAKLDYERAKEQYQLIVDEQKRILREARDRYDNANSIYKQEVTRVKQEIAAAKARTKAVRSDHKSRVAAARAEVARVRAAEQREQRDRD